MKIEIRDLHFTYPTGVEALRGITLTIESGEQVAIVGQNGAGKTTLVKHLNGLLLPTSGEVRIGGWDTRSQSVAKLARRVGYVFQNPDEQLFSKNVETEVAFGPRNLKLDKEQVQRLVADALAMNELADKTKMNPYDLSASRSRRVGDERVSGQDQNESI